MKRKILMLGLIVLVILCIPVIAKAAENTNVQVQRNVYSNNGSMKFNFTGLTLDTTHEYEYGFTKTAATQVEKWYLITEYTASAATIDITTTKELREVINAVDTGYITIKDKTADDIVLQPYAVDLKIPYLQLTNYTVINNGKEFGTNQKDCINIALRNANSSKAYYQYEKITDENLINKYKEIKNKNGNYLELESMLKTSVPTANWQTWSYWNGHDTTGMGGYGYTESPIKTPSTGLYYMWIYFSGNNLKPLYGVILVDNLQPEVAVESISLPKTATCKLGTIYTIKYLINPTGATNKIITWSSSDESVATVDNVGRITPKKVGSTIITAVSQDGNKKATCTVTVIAATNNNNTNSDSTNVDNNKKDDTTATGKLPQTGFGMGITVTIGIVAIISLGSYIGYRRLKGI